MSDSDFDNYPISEIPRNDGSDEEEEVAENGSVKDEDMGSLAPTDDSSDDKPISQDFDNSTPRKMLKNKKAPATKKKAAPKRKAESEDSEEEMDDFVDSDDDDNDDDEFSDSQTKTKTTKRARASRKPKAKTTRKSTKVKEEDMEIEEEEDFEEEEKPSSRKRAGTRRKPAAKRQRVGSDDVEAKVENLITKAKAVKKSKELTPIQLVDRAVQAFKWWEHQREDNDVYWTTLQHNGVTFQPPYQPHGVPLYYNGKPIQLTPEQEEIATLYAMVGEDAIQLREEESAKIFKGNFFKYFKDEMGAGSVVKSLDKCDFSHIRQYLEERKKNTVKATAEEKQNQQLHMGYMIIDGNLQKTGNFVVEPPSLFRGRGLHPKMGTVKMRVIPEQVVLNVDPDMAVPPCPMPGHNWDTLVYKPDASWIAHWIDNVNNMGKYVGVNATSFLKGENDMEKYEVARRLKGVINHIRTEVLKDLHSESMRERQLATAIWIIDKLALRVGNEKSEEEADTVGCCSLRVEHLSFEDPYTLTMDFLAKDSMRYYQTIRLSKYEGGKAVFKNLKKFCSDKDPEDDVFNYLTTTSLNAKLTSYMPKLTAKVFRTFNASVTLEKQLHETYPEGTSLDEMVTQYNDANRQVAILCNHQRSLPKNWEENTAKKRGKLDTMKNQIEELKKMLNDVEKGKEIKLMPEKYRTPLPKLELSEDMSDETKKKLKEERQLEMAERSKFSHMFKQQPSAEQVRKRLATFEARATSFEIKLKDLDANKLVALGTSKINYMDPRITVAWCKRNQVPIEKIFTTALRNKHNWAMCVPESYRFYIVFLITPLFVCNSDLESMESIQDSDRLNCFPFVNNTFLRYSSHIHIKLREIHGIQLNNSITEWDITQFLKTAFIEPFTNLIVQFKEETIVDFYSCQKNVEIIVKEMDQRKAGMNGKNLIISASIIPPLSEVDWISFFGENCIQQFHQLPVGKRPDTVILSNLPVKWFHLEEGVALDANHEVVAFLSQYGKISIIDRLDSSPLFVTIGVVYQTYEGFRNCILSLQNHVITKESISKTFLLDLSFDKTEYFSDENIHKRKKAVRRNEHEQKKKQKELKKKERLMKELREKCEKKQEEVQTLLKDYRDVTHSRLMEIEKELEVQRAEESVEVLTGFSHKLSHYIREIKHLGEKARKQQKTERIQSVRNALSQLQDLIVCYTNQTEMISELSWMEERRKRAEGVMVSIESLTDEEKFNKQEDCLKKVQQAIEWMKMTLEGQKCMERLEQTIENLQNPLDSLKDSPFIKPMEEAEKGIRDRFMKVNETCLNLRQMENFEERMKSWIQDYISQGEAYRKIITLQQKHKDLVQQIIQLAKTVVNRKYLLTDMNDQSEVCEETLVNQHTIQRINKLFENTIHSLLQDSHSVDPTCIKELEEGILDEEQFIIFIQFVQAFDSYQQTFNKVQKSTHHVMMEIEKVRETEKAYHISQVSEEEREIIPLPEWSELNDGEQDKLIEGLCHGNHLFASDISGVPFVDRIRSYISSMNGFLKTSEYFVKSKQEACKATRKIIDEHVKRVDHRKQEMVDRFIYLKNRKRCIENELRILETRKQRCIEKKKQGVIRSEISQASSLWNWSDHDFISDYYNGKEDDDYEEKRNDEVVCKKKSDHHIQFRFNSEKGCFEEIVM